MNIDHPLMENNITRQDLDAVIQLLKHENAQLTQGSNVVEFEQEWSDWLGVRYSIFVNSGSSANLISIAVLKEIYGEGEIIVPPITWVSDIASVLQNGFKPVFSDVNPRTLSMDTEKILEKITPRTKAVFLTHAQGFNGLTDRLLLELERKRIPLIEDVCEAHGATHNGDKLGTFGIVSNFSFYYAHHMSTIEGGMVCTNNQNIYEMARMFRSHGLVRESSSREKKSEYAEKYGDLNPEFIFAYPGYNVRSNEIGGVLGRSQLKRLDENNLLRSENFRLFLNNLDSDRFRTDFYLDGSCNYAFNIILNEADVGLRDRIESAMSMAGIEYRRGSAGGGNQMRQPYLRRIVNEGDWTKYPEAEHIHFFGWYIGNYPSLEEERILQICSLLNEV